MGTYILTSMFPNGFNQSTAKLLDELIEKREAFAFVASEFEMIHEKTDRYYRHFLALLAHVGIRFNRSFVVDGRMTPSEARKAVAEADTVWLAGGDTPTQFGYFQKYGLTDIIRSHSGTVIGMSAGSINMAETAICTLTCGHKEQLIYPAIGCIDISVEPHFDINNVSRELIDLSHAHTIYGLCDDALIIRRNGGTSFHGDVYMLRDGTVAKL